jgi:hypothetical protein
VKKGSPFKLIIEKMISIFHYLGDNDEAQQNLGDNDEAQQKGEP